jgi:hypothetical protein
MPALRAVVISLFLFVLGGCSLLQHENDVDVVLVAKQLLTVQTDRYGDPLPVQLPVQVNYTITRKPQIDREMHIDFQFIALKAIPVLRFGFTTSDGLELVSSDVRERYLKLKPRETFSKDVIVEPTAENEFYLNLFVVTENGDEKLAKLIKVPIAIGDYALKGTKASVQ